MEILLIGFLIFLLVMFYKYQRELWFGVKEPAEPKTLEEQIAKLSPEWQATIKRYKELTQSKTDIDL